MQENLIQEGQEPQQEPTQNQQVDFNKLKELERKHEELLKQLEEQRKLNLELLAKMSQTSSATNPSTLTGTSGISSFEQFSEPTAPVDEEDLNQLFLTNPTKAIQKVLEKEKEALRKELPKQVSEIATRVYQRQIMVQEALRRYPELNDPNSEFYNAVAKFLYQRPYLYEDPEGILNACARVAEELRHKTTPLEKQRQAVSSATVEGAQTAQVTSEPELDYQGKILAQKLGLDPKEMAKRLDRYLKKEGEYKPEFGQQFKAKLR